ncbi:MAG TPA: hypothetical protein VEV39_04180 [Gemmatimonadales bacterium]|nr:hypothetical protein [Gemmatimonadales bacterium]
MSEASDRFNTLFRERLLSVPPDERKSLPPERLVRMIFEAQEQSGWPGIPAEMESAVVEQMKKMAPVQNRVFDQVKGEFADRPKDAETGQAFAKRLMELFMQAISSGPKPPA